MHALEVSSCHETCQVTLLVLCDQFVFSRVALSRGWTGILIVITLRTDGGFKGSCAGL